MGDQAPKEGPGFGSSMLGKLKFVGGKVVDLGGKVVDVGKDVGTRVGGTVADLGSKVVDAAGAGIKSFTVDEFERLRQLNQVAKQQHDLRKKYTDEELKAVEAKADLVLGQLYSGYFEEKFDPVAYELSKLADSDNQDHIDELVERLTGGVEVRGGCL